MAEKNHEISFGSTGGELYVRFDGDGTRDTCRVANQLVNDYIGAHRDAPALVFDLRQCGWVDSTFAGWMVGLRKRIGDIPDGSLCVAGWSDACRESLERMNLCKLFEQRAADEPAQVRSVSYSVGEAPDDVSIALMARAHRELAELGDENRRVFGPIADMLEKQLEQTGSQ